MRLGLNPLFFAVAAATLEGMYSFRLYLYPLLLGSEDFACIDSLISSGHFTKRALLHIRCSSTSESHQSSKRLIEGEKSG